MNKLQLFFLLVGIAQCFSVSAVKKAVQDTKSESDTQVQYRKLKCFKEIGKTDQERFAAKKIKNYAFLKAVQFDELPGVHYYLQGTANRSENSRTGKK